MPSGSIRTFVACTLDGPAAAALQGLQEHLRSSGVSATWESIEKLHITVRFLGDVMPETLDRITAALTERCATFLPVDVLFTHLGGFPTLDAPRVIWAGAFETEPLLSIFRDVESSIRSCGLTEERRAPHVHATIARVKPRDDVSRLTGAVKSFTFDPILTRASSLSIMKSVLHQGGSTYTRVTTIPFSRTRSSHD
jgi:2'-5' RNA ligase